LEDVIRIETENKGLKNIYGADFAVLKNRAVDQDLYEEVEDPQSTG
jgi:hypothetical protein